MQRFRIGHRLAGGGDLEGAHRELVPGCIHAALGLALGHLGLVLLAGLHDVGADQFGSDLGKNQTGADRAPEITDGIGHRDLVEQILGVAHAGIVDGVGGQADGGRDSLGPGPKAGRKPHVKTGNLGRNIGGCQTDRTHDHGKYGLGGAVTGHPAHELGPNAVAHGEEKHGEENMLNLGRNGNVQLPDEDPDQQRTRHRAQAEVAQFDAADVVAQGQREEEGQGGIVPQNVDDPEFARWRSLWSSRLGLGILFGRIRRLGVLGGQQNPAVTPILAGLERRVLFDPGGLRAADGYNDQYGQDGDGANPAHSS